MDICNTLVLDVLQKINGSRKWSGIFYIVTGKKTSQSLSDSQWFGIEHYYAALKGMSHEQFHQVLENLLKLGWIETKEENMFVVTKKGYIVLKDTKKHYNFLEKLNGLKFSAIDQLCWQVITLYSQAISNSLYNYAKYSPVVRERVAVQQVKNLFPKTDLERIEAGKRLYAELFRVLSSLDPLSSEVFVRKLSGYDRIGLTFEQLAKEIQLSKLESILRFQSVLHQILRYAGNEPEEFPFIFSLIGKYLEAPALTISASQTYQLLQSEKTIDEIMRIRRLKLSTLEDHLVEIARTIPQFSIRPYISDEDIQQVACFFDRTKENKLRPIKEAFPHLSYLQIRLVLAKEGGKNAS